jgi:ribosomal protein S18 acetylase RimI-like enzyme
VVLLVFENELAVGLAIAFEAFSTFNAKPYLNLHDLIVRNSARGKGIAKNILSQLESIAIQRGYCKITLEVLEGNVRAQKVYRDFGFSSYSLSENTGRAMFWEKKL